MALRDSEGINTEHYAAAVVLLALVALWAIKRGFRGIDLGGVSAKVGG